MSYQNENKKTKLVLVAGILAIGLLAAGLFGSLSVANKASAQTDLQLPGTTNTTKPTVSTAGTATTSVQPDKVSVTIGVETNGTTAEEAASKNADLMAQVIAALKELGISDDQISTSNYNVYPVYEYKEPTQPCIMIYPPPPECQPKQEVVGYKTINSITVTLDVEGDAEASEVIDAAIEAGANNVNGVYFFVSQELQQEVRDSLIKEAIDNARQRAEIAADAVGHSVSSVQSIHLNEVYFPVFYGRDAVSEAAVSTPLMPGEQEVSMTVNVSFYMTDILA